MRIILPFPTVWPCARAALLGLLLMPGFAAAEQWEVGGAGGTGIYSNGTIFSRAGQGTAGIRNRFTLSAALTEHRFRRVSGELRYTYQDGDPFISAAGRSTNIEGQSHSIHYDALIHVRGWRKLAPFLEIGGGAKAYRVTGPLPTTPSLTQYARFRQDSDVKPLLVFGAGFKYPLLNKVFLRFDFLDYLTPFPGDIIVPATGGNIRGLMHQLTPMLGISVTP